MKLSRGFTLIELMVVIAIVGIIAAIALPSFNEQLRKSRRSEAMEVISDLQLKQEQWRSNHTQYAADMDTLLGSTANTTSYNNSHSYYTAAISASSGTDTLITVSPKGAQSGDRCGNYTLRIDNDDNNTPAGRTDKASSTGASGCL